MRIFGLAGLVLALLIVGLLARKQMAASPPAAVLPGADGASAAAPDPRVRAQRMQEEIRRSVDAAMQAPRPLPEEP